MNTLTARTATNGKFTNIYGGHCTGKTYRLNELAKKLGSAAHQAYTLKGGLGHITRLPLSTVVLVDGASKSDKAAIKRLLKLGYAVVAASLEQIVIN